MKWGNYLLSASLLISYFCRFLSHFGSFIISRFVCTVFVVLTKITVIYPSHTFHHAAVLLVRNSNLSLPHETRDTRHETRHKSRQKVTYLLHCTYIHWQKQIKTCHHWCPQYPAQCANICSFYSSHHGLHLKPKDGNNKEPTMWSVDCHPFH